jgi:5-(carboxyamino)imidazole ribonucleotide synthase
VRVGFLGGGQLARMMALSGIPLGIASVFLDPAPDACAGAAGELIVDAYDSADGLDRLAEAAEVVTFEFESVPASSAERLASHVAVHPPPRALEVAQDRLYEKQLFERLGIETTGFLPIGSQEDLDAAGRAGVLKTRRLGYDGKGQRVLADARDAAGVFDELGGVPLLLEDMVRFDRELSAIAVRSQDGDVRCYPLVENHHAEGILRVTHAPAPDLAPELQELGERYVAAALDELDYVGVLALELFQVGDRLLANEMAPRVHNSGHWTIEGAETSQFENHLRAVCRLPLGDVAARGSSTMVNLIGAVPDEAAVLAVEGAHLHLYGKAPRPGRKLGHVTVTGGGDWRRIAELAGASTAATTPR